MFRDVDRGTVVLDHADVGHRVAKHRRHPETDHVHSLLVRVPLEAELVRVHRAGTLMCMTR